RADAPEMPTVRLAPWTGQPVTVNLAVGRTTAVTFPAAITSIVTTANKQTLTLETAGSRLFLSPLVPDYAGEIFVILGNDDQVPLLARSVAPEKADQSLRLALESLHFPGLLAVHTERDSLAPRATKPDEARAAQQKTKVYLVRVPE